MFARRTAAALLVAGLLLAGCSEDPEPRFAPTQSPSPTESETTAAPEAQSPEEFVREWVRTYNSFETDGDDEQLEALHRNCATCETVLSVVSQAYANGGFVKSDGWTVEKSEELYRRDNAAGVRTQVAVSPSRYKASESSEVTRGTGGRVTMEFDLVRRDGGWRLSDLTRKPS